jgi:hypothetical protein
MDWANKDVKFPSSEDGSQIFEVHCLFISGTQLTCASFMFCALESNLTDTWPFLGCWIIDQH